ncbi:MAG: exonuclease domain-containing protein [Hyphomicrobiaceae bacterium]
MSQIEIDALREIDPLIVVDLEATCSDDNSIPPGKTETIEIGAVVVDVRRFAIAAEFQSFVQPVRNPKLSEFCTNLTGITQDMLHGAPAFTDAFAALTDWIDEQAPKSVFCSWGAYDRRQFEQDCRLHGAGYAMPPHANLKALFAIRQSSKKRFGMAKALELCGMPLLGQHHRALDDARNIAALLPWIVGEQRLKL